MMGRILVRGSEYNSGMLQQLYRQKEGGIEGWLGERRNVDLRPRYHSGLSLHTTKNHREEFYNAMGT